ncbi:MAG: chemotaxis protein CheD [Paracoccaceae bacterium]
MTEAAVHTLHVIQGEHRISDHRDLVMTTVLGSCVAACLHDPVRRIGGMNHFLLPDMPGAHDIRFASAAMEQLVNSLLKQGGRRDRLMAKLFGGARMIAGLPDIGQRNGEAALAFLQGEGIPVSAQSLGGSHARRVRFWPESGRAQQMLLVDTGEVPINPPRPDPGGTIELF